jgi:two-component system chemotaxis sensor kinase CheA
MAGVLEGKRIFLIEDDILNVGVFTTALARQGAMIQQDVLGYGIVQHIIENLPIDLIILDIMLKRGQDGYQIFEQIKTDPRLSGIPTVAVTSMDPETHIAKAKAAGLSGFISKPINALEFPKLIARVLGGEKVWIISR